MNGNVGVDLLRDEDEIVFLPVVLAVEWPILKVTFRHAVEVDRMLMIVGEVSRNRRWIRFEFERLEEISGDDERVAVIPTLDSMLIVGDENETHWDFTRRRRWFAGVGASTTWNLIVQFDRGFDGSSRRCFGTSRDFGDDGRIGRSALFNDGRLGR